MAKEHRHSLVRLGALRLMRVATSMCPMYSTTPSGKSHLADWYRPLQVQASIFRLMVQALAPLLGRLQP